MKISKQARRDAKQLFLTCRTNGVLDEGKVRQVTSHLIAQKPRGYLSILSRLHRLVKLDLERRTARIESAVALTPAQQSELTSQLTHRYGAGLNFSFGIDPALLGGVRIRTGNDVYDSSVRARLNALAESF
jgi:F-type H+-transporting ATPase subunit delta